MSDTENVIEFPDVVVDDHAVGEVPAPPTPNYHTVLEAWRAVLRPALTLRTTEKVSPQYATKMIQSYPELTYVLTEEVRVRYYEKLVVLMKILDDVIDSDDECLNQATAVEDVAENSEHYRQLILDWNLQFLKWELEWSCGDDDAAIEIAALAEAHKMFFGDRGLLPHLESIQFQYTEADQQALADALNAYRDEYFAEEK